MKNNTLSYKACVKLLSQQDNILVVTHRNPDGDTAGSAAAVCSALRRMGKTAYLYRNAQFNDKLLDYVGKYLAPENFKPGFVFAVDVASENMFANGYDAEVDLCIDHHPSNTHYAKNYIVKAEKSACAEAIFELITEMHHNLTNEEATLLYIALSTDTGCFQYSNTNSASFKTAAKLLEYGADSVQVNTRFFRKISAARMKLEGMINSSMSFHRNGTVVVAIITQDMLRESGATDNDTDDLAGLAGRVEGGILSITIKEMPNGAGSKVSLRSTSEVNSSDICAVFGGGGHAMAAGCVINSSPEKAKEMLLAVVDELWK